MEKIKSFLDSIGVSEDIQKNLFSEESPEDFNVENAANQFIQKRRELTLNDSDILNNLKQRFNNEQYPAIAKPIIKRLQSLGGLSSDELAAITPEGKKLPDLKSLFDLAENKFKQSAAGSVDEVKQQFFELQNQFNQAKETHQSELDRLRTEFAEKERMNRVKSRFNKAVSGLDLVLPTDAATTLLETSLFNKYRFDVDDKGELIATNPDGTRAADEKDFLSASDLIKRTADSFKILKKSNGGGTGEAPPVKTRESKTPNSVWNRSAQSNRLAEMQRKIEEQNK